MPLVRGVAWAATASNRKLRSNWVRPNQPASRVQAARESSAASRPSPSAAQAAAVHGHATLAIQWIQLPVNCGRWPDANKRRGSIHTMKIAKASNSRTLRLDSRRSNRLRVPLASNRRSEEHTSELQSLRHLVCRLLLD